MTKMCNTLRPITRLAAIVSFAAFALNASLASAQQPSLGTAQNFAVLGASTVTNTGPTLVTGDVGVSPGTAITGFPPGIVVGTIHAGDLVAVQAHADAFVAYAMFKALPCVPANNLTGQDLGAVGPLPAGVYCFDTSAQLTGTLVLDGAGPWTFQTGTTLTTATGALVSVVNNTDTCRGANVTWQIGSSATLGTATNFAGTILAFTSITATTGVSVSGRLVAINAAVTLDTNAVSACGAGAVVPPDECKRHCDCKGDKCHDGGHDGDDDGHHCDKDHDKDHHEGKDKDGKDKDKDGKEKGKDGKDKNKDKDGNDTRG